MVSFRSLVPYSCFRCSFDFPSPSISYSPFPFLQLFTFSISTSNYFLTPFKVVLHERYKLIFLIPPLLLFLWWWLNIIAWACFFISVFLVVWPSQPLLTYPHPLHPSPLHPHPFPGNQSQDSKDREKNQRKNSNYTLKK